jgi:L-asparaginase
MVWTKDKIYLTALFAALIVAIIVTLYFNRKGQSCSSETYAASHKKIYILYTGGTIGMVETPDGYAPKPGFLENKLKEMTKNSKNIAPYDIGEYTPLLDSSNMTPKDWVTIASDIAKRYDKYDAFVVIHGTDTMAYTASALAFMLENTSKPIIITGSMISLQEERNDGRNNLLTSLMLATRMPELKSKFQCIARFCIS